MPKCSRSGPQVSWSRCSTPKGRASWCATATSKRPSRSSPTCSKAAERPALWLFAVGRFAFGFALVHPLLDVGYALIGRARLLVVDVRVFGDRRFVEPLA